jgi:4-amino-4-deoxy-L-arabinose transferase-like glycosyltransferase
MKNLFKKNYLLALIITLFLATRLYQISEIPASLYWDEASIGYNAYSILVSGKDEWGDFLPLHFRAFGEFKLPVYIYATVPFVAIFGLNELSVRLPSVFFSLISIIMTYLLTRYITRINSMGLTAAFMLTISPWFFIFSRTGYEATAGLAFFLAGTYFFLISVDKKWLLFGGTLCFILSMYSYNSFRIVTPIAFTILLIYLLKKQAASLLAYCTALFIAGLVPIIIFFFRGGDVRLQTVGVIDRSLGLTTNIVNLFTNYFSHLSPSFLFISGDSNLRSHTGGIGELYIFDLLFILVALVFIFKQKFFLYYLPIVFIVCGILPAALTREVPHALRTISVVPFVMILSAIGAGVIFEKLPVKKGSLLVLILMMTFFTSYLIHFLNEYNFKSSANWQYAYKEIFKNYASKFNSYDKVIVSDDYGQPYIFYLFYQKVDPQSFREKVTYSPVNDWGFSTVSDVNNVKFKKKNDSTQKVGKLLLFLTPEEKIEGGEKLGEIKNLDGSLAFIVYETN